MPRGRLSVLTMRFMWLEFPISGLWADSQQILAKYRLPTSRSTSPEKQSAEIPISAHPNPFSQELTLRFEQSDEQGGKAGDHFIHVELECDN